MNNPARPISHIFFQLTNLRALQSIWTEALILGSVAGAPMMCLMLSKSAKPKREEGR